MVGWRITLFRLFDFEVRIDLSWLLLAALVTWSLASGFFPFYVQGLTSFTYWWMAAAAAGGLFASILFHEFGHAIVAKRHGIRIRSITLFIFGGVAEMESEPPSAKSEFLMAIAGPIASVFLAGLFFGGVLAVRLLNGPISAEAILQYLCWTNLALVAFNLVPAFPLDGGRVLRAALWQLKQSLPRATRIASNIGIGFAFVLMGLGFLSVVVGNLMGGFWWVLLGLFIRSASRRSYQQVLLREALDGETVSHLMTPAPITVSPSVPVQQLLDEFFYRHHHKLLPVVEEGRLVGCVTLDQIKRLPPENWNHFTAADISQPCSEANTIGSSATAMGALAKMKRAQNSRLMVVEQGELVGILSLKDLLQFLSLNTALAREDAPLNHV